ncbi:MAG: hypothetical protein GVY26_18625 [Bacteroidetes bacterium]|nr:hypothetical protein [Bacteroidota bacterium]
MKTYTIILLLISILTLSCSANRNEKNQENSRTERPAEPDKHSTIHHEEDKGIYEMTNDSLWNHLVFKKGGCLTGGQYVREGRFGGAGCVMTNSKGWEIFFNRDRNEISDFLISKISDDTVKTHIHTCPFFYAIEGEVAVYGLQKMYGLNWFDFEAFKAFQNRQSESLMENHQAWLQRILEDDKKRKTLIDCWKGQASR